MTPFGFVDEHLAVLQAALADLSAQAAELEEWGRLLAGSLADGRLLIAGNGGSAAEAQHLSAELVGRFEGERRPLSALVLHGDTSSTSAICNDYGRDEVYARQVEAHGRAGDVLLLLTTSGRSSNLLSAAERARALGISVWALTGPAASPLACARRPGDLDLVDVDVRHPGGASGGGARDLRGCRAAPGRTRGKARVRG
jgi:phosphoheptose isomerase